MFDWHLEAKVCFDEDREIDDYEMNEVYAFRTKGRFTPYAVLATLARAYQWEGNLSEAKVYAQVILDEKKVAWVHHSTMTSSAEREWDRTFSAEHIFSITMYNFKNEVPNFFGSSAPTTSLLNISDIKMDQIFEISAKSYGTDYRYACNFQYEGSDQYFLKYKQNEGGSFLNKIPVIKLGEMALIIAEAYLAEGDIETAVSYLNLIRENRGSYIASDALPSTLIASEVEDEIYKEYRKDHLGEGQMFMFYKRKDYNQIPGTNVNARGIYTLALPDNEKEFGNQIGRAHV